MSTSSITFLVFDSVAVPSGNCPNAVSISPTAILMKGTVPAPAMTTERSERSATLNNFGPSVLSRPPTLYCVSVAKTIPSRQIKPAAIVIGYLIIIFSRRGVINAAVGSRKLGVEGRHQFQIGHGR